MQRSRLSSIATLKQGMRETSSVYGLEPSSYVNSGVLTLRPKLLNEDLLSSFVAFSNSNPGLVHPDQDFLNYHFRGKINALSEKFNFQTGIFEYRLVQPLAFYHGKILHYVGRCKPLNGTLSPATLPFSSHTYKTPELAKFSRTDMSCVVPFPHHGDRVTLYPAVRARPRPGAG